ncbi:unnamed protein product [Ilex paraguariensis]|uniref:Uncharacterized protein n=1 Tax=Ilex paraguariensis TaxID=185542 RepID=A0ABC8TZ00_9AQUA
MEKSRVEASSPLATVEDIQKRLVRPLSLPSQSSNPMVTSRDNLLRRNSSQFNTNSIELCRKREVTNKRLEDYLDPVLLSAMCSKIGGKRINSGEIKLQREFDRFEWPVDELKEFVEGSRTEKRVKLERNEAVNLPDDLDFIGGTSYESGDEEVSCTPFRRFEKTAFKLLNG